MARNAERRSRASRNLRAPSVGPPIAAASRQPGEQRGGAPPARGGLRLRTGISRPQCEQASDSASCRNRSPPGLLSEISAKGGEEELDDVPGGEPEERHPDDLHEERHAAVAVSERVFLLV